MIEKFKLAREAGAKAMDESESFHSCPHTDRATVYNWRMGYINAAEKLTSVEEYKARTYVRSFIVINGRLELSL